MLCALDVQMKFYMQELEFQKVHKDMLRFNHSFWYNHNKEFQDEKKKFIAGKNLQGMSRATQNLREMLLR